ncbi:MAG TPA: rhodanese-like domain-containing protein, partial [Methylococcaceae bacterium]|nr:rhodanese-like domain-containing protein [Methylococcaceae bacterium]
MDRYLEFILNHYILSLAFALVTFLLLQEFFDALFRRFETLSPLLAVAKINDHNTIILDVREAPDFIQGHIEGAINTPLSKFSEHLPQLEKYKKNVLLLTCQTGTRANAAAKLLMQSDFKHILILSGGMSAWQDEYK